MVMDWVVETYVGIFEGETEMRRSGLGLLTLFQLSPATPRFSHRPLARRQFVKVTVLFVSFSLT